MVGAPPLRTADDQAALWDACAPATSSAIGSDNTSWTAEQKAVGTDDFTKMPYGVPGLETEMRVIYSEGVSQGRIGSTPSSRRVRHQPRAHLRPLPAQRAPSPSAATPTWSCSIRTGARPSTSGSLHSRAGYDPFHGFSSPAVPVHDHRRAAKSSPATATC